MAGRVAVVVATRDRAAELRRTLERLEELPERPRVLVVDNASTDQTVASVRERHPEVEVVALERDLGAGARTVGARRLKEPYVAFADDDSWWAPGALERAAALFDRHPRLGLVGARVLVGPEEQEDPVSTAMGSGSLPPAPGSAGRPVLGFVACGAVVRRSAFLAVGGFDSRYGIGGEEEVLALDLATAGWELAYVPEIVAHHHPSKARDPDGRRRRQTRNALWTTWLRSPPLAALRRTAQLVRPASRDAAVRAGALDAVRGLPWVLKERRPLPRELERRRAALEGSPS